MAPSDWLSRHPLPAFGLILGLAMILSAGSIGGSLLEAKRLDSQSLAVTGSAQKPIEANLARWVCRVSRQGNSLPSVTRSLGQDLQALSTYLQRHQLMLDAQTRLPLQVTTLYQPAANGGSSNVIEGYRVTQGISVESPNVAAVTQASQETASLVEQGIGVDPEPPQYLFTGLDKLKIAMLGDAMENAKNRAQQMAQRTGNTVGVIRNASMGVFQITPRHSTEVSDYGENDTTAREKTVTAVVNVTFAIR